MNGNSISFLQCLYIYMLHFWKEHVTAYVYPVLECNTVGYLLRLSLPKYDKMAQWNDNYQYPVFLGNQNLKPPRLFNSESRLYFSIAIDVLSFSSGRYKQSKYVMEELSEQALSALILSLQYLLVTCILTSMHIKATLSNRSHDQFSI